MLFMVSTGRAVVGVVGRPRVFPGRMPSGKRYWTLLDDDLEPVVEEDEFLRHLRFGRDAAESTTRSYAGGIALFLRADLANAMERSTRQTQRISQLEKKLSHLLGDNAWRESGLGAPTDIDVLQQRITSLEQQLVDVAVRRA